MSEAEETKVEGAVEGEGAAVEGEAGATAEGEAGATAEGEAGATAEGEAGATAEGEAAATAEGEGGPADGEAAEGEEKKEGEEGAEGEEKKEGEEGAEGEGEEKMGIKERIEADPHELNFLVPLPEVIEFYKIPKINDARSVWRLGMRKLEETFAEHIANMHLDFEDKANQYQKI